MHCIYVHALVCMCMSVCISVCACLCVRTAAGSEPGFANNDVKEQSSRLLWRCISGAPGQMAQEQCAALGQLPGPACLVGRQQWEVRKAGCPGLQVSSQSQKSLMEITTGA